MMISVKSDAMMDMKIPLRFPQDGDSLQIVVVRMCSLLLAMLLHVVKTTVLRRKDPEVSWQHRPCRSQEVNGLLLLLVTL